MMCYIDIIPFLISELVVIKSVKKETVKEIEKGRKIAARMIRAGQQMLKTMDSLENKLCDQKVDMNSVDVDWKLYYKKTDDDSYECIQCDSKKSYVSKFWIQQHCFKTHIRNKELDVTINLEDDSEDDIMIKSENAGYESELSELNWSDYKQVHEKKEEKMKNQEIENKVEKEIEDDREEEENAVASRKKDQKIFHEDLTIKICVILNKIMH